MKIYIKNFCKIIKRIYIYVYALYLTFSFVFIFICMRYHLFSIQAFIVINNLLFINLFNSN